MWNSKQAKLNVDGLKDVKVRKGIPQMAFLLRARPVISTTTITATCSINQ
jgi:hypothetical protein